ncbi:hypothetical protein BH160DRAFT_1316 [Burkholderia sp. H160]|nr:hypothetical protein BH160DRAFT_1316 [Burkholderia sp. H160]
MPPLIEPQLASLVDRHPMSGDDPVQSISIRDS